MGWIARKCFRVGVGSVMSAMSVEEPAGFTDKWITLSGQSPRNKKDWFRVPRRDDVVYSTQKEAMAKAVQ